MHSRSCALRWILRVGVSLHGVFVPQPHGVPVRVEELSSISPRVRSRRVRECDTPVGERAVETIDVIDLEVERALRLDVWRLREQDGEVRFVANSGDARVWKFELDLESKCLDVPVSCSVSVRDVQSQVIELRVADGAPDRPHWYVDPHPFRDGKRKG